MLAIRDLVVEYASDGYRVRPVNGFNLDAGDGELVVLLGPSGCGKTTLLSCLAAILTPASGSIQVAGQEITDLDREALAAYRRYRVGVVFQAFNLIASLSALDNVAAPLLVAGVPRRKARGRAARLLDMVGLGDRAGHRPAQLSGGQQQRVAFARGLAHDPPLLLADEPTANLDYVQAESIIGLLRELRRPGRLVVVSTHDHRIVPVADRVVEMSPRSSPDAGPPELVEVAAGEVIFEQGSYGERVYVVERGEVDIVRVRADGSEERLATVGQGEYFGELGPLLGFPRSATARAATAVLLTAYSARDFRAKVRGDALPTGPNRTPEQRAAAGASHAADDAIDAS